MPPLRFNRLLDLAKDLSQSADTHSSPAQCEIMRRAAVGRAYYAAFLVGRTKFGITATSGVHALVEARIRRNDPALGFEYEALRALREVADYQFPPIDPAKADWETIWLSAEDLATNLLQEIPNLT